MGDLSTAEYLYDLRWMRASSETHSATASPLTRAGASLADIDGRLGSPCRRDECAAKEARKVGRGVFASILLLISIAGDRPAEEPPTSDNKHLVSVRCCAVF